MNYRIVADKYNWILQTKRVVKDESSSNYGEEFWDNTSYFSSLEMAVRRLFEHLTKAQLGSDNQLLDAIGKAHETIALYMEDLLQKEQVFEIISKRRKANA